MHIPASRGPFHSLYDWYHQMRTARPIFREESNQIWHLFRYADVVRVLSDSATFSSMPAPDRSEEGSENPLRNPISSTMIQTDPPHHRQLRGLVSQAFTPRMVAQLEPRISAITNELLNRVASQGKMDVVCDLATPLPVTVIAELLGIPASRHEDFKRWSDAVLASHEKTTEEEQRALSQDIENMFQFLIQVLQERREHPQNDLVSALLSASIEGRHLSDQELLGFCVLLLLVAGNETTTNLLGNLIVCLDEHPDTLARLRADRQLLPAAIEEALRYYSPVKTTMRLTTTAVTLGAQRIEAGQMICAWMGSANRDEAEWPDANRFLLERDPRRHVAFGHGIHFCLGAPLARLEVKIALSAMLDRLPGSWQVSAAQLPVIESAGVLGVKNLPLAWETKTSGR